VSKGSEDNTVPPVGADRMAQLWRRLKDHRTAQWTVGYVAVAYGIQHGVILTSESFEWPNAVARISMLLLVLGLPFAIVLAWYHGNSANRRISGGELAIVSTLLVIGAFLFYTFARPGEEVARAPSSGTQQASIAPGASSASPAAGAMSLAVLPFVNLSGDASQEFFSDGMTEEITAALAKVPSLRVVARTSAFEFKGQNRDVAMIGQALHASHLIEGSVRKAGNRVRITAQLVKASDGTHLWTESYDRELKDVFAVQEDIAQAIAASLQVPLGLNAGQNLIANRTADTDSYQDYLRARGLLRTRGTSSREAIAVLEKVVARDPNFAPAWALLAYAYGLAPGNLERTRIGSIEQARPAIPARPLDGAFVTLNRRRA
jgi:TolB-like protein